MLCTTVVHNDRPTHTYEQFLKPSVGLGLVFVRLFRFSILRVCFRFSFDCIVLVLFVFVV